MKQVRITVLRKQLYEDLVVRFLSEPPSECVCDFFKEGDSFLYTGGAENARRVLSLGLDRHLPLRLCPLLRGYLHPMAAG